MERKQSPETPINEGFLAPSRQKNRDKGTNESQSHYRQ